MAKSKSKEMREFAESVIKGLKEEPRFGLFNTEGLATSLVRQWLTYDGTAALHIGSALLFLSLTRSPQEVLTVKHEFSGSNWLRELVEDWKVPEEGLLGLINQFNLTQNAEITNHDGLVIRWHVNPKEKIIGVDHKLQSDGQRPTEVPKQARIAERLEKAFGGKIHGEAVSIFADSVLNQWKQFNGQATIFTEESKLTLLHENLKNGGYSITISETNFPTKKELEKAGVLPHEIFSTIAQFNLVKGFFFLDKNEESHDIWYDRNKNCLMWS